jgi:GNAT superfamily N-acetyltransferase
MIMDGYKIVTISPGDKPDSPLHTKYAEHLKRIEDSHHAFTPEDGEGFVIVAMKNNRVVGHISIKHQPIAHRDDLPIELLEMPNKRFTDTHPPGLVEGFVQTFEVEEDYQRRGIGSQLQQAAFAECCQRGLYQMRSWSSLDRPANFALKIALGFAVHPGHYYLSKQNKWVAGAYFVKSCKTSMHPDPNTNLYFPKI